MDIIKKLKKQILQMSHISQEGHIASSFSILDVLWVLYDKILNINPNNVKNENRDIFILSKAHASLGLYVVLAEKGFISQLDLYEFCKYNGILGGHPNKNKINGVEVSTGSLGHGLPIAVGMALANKIKNINSKVYCLIGDGESNEGSIWESALLANQYNLDNLVCIVDYNHSTDRAINMGSIASKFINFGWDAEIVVGHNHTDLYNVLKKNIRKSTVIIAETIKGYGCKSIENNFAWHHKSPNKYELDLLLSELGV